MEVTARLLRAALIAGKIPVTDRHRPIFEDARPQPFLDQADDALVADPVFDETDEPFLAHRPEEVPDVGVKNVVHPPVGDPHH